MPAYEYCNTHGRECFDRLFLSWRDAPDAFETTDGLFVKQFPSPAIRFKGPFSGATSNKYHLDDGSEYEPGVREDQSRKKQEKADEREQARKDFLADQVSTYDV